MGPAQGAKKAVSESPCAAKVDDGKQTDHVFSPAEFTGHDHPRFIRVNVSAVVQQIVVRLIVVEEYHGDTSSVDVHDFACCDTKQNKPVKGMRLNSKVALTIFSTPFRHPEPQFFGGQVECIPNQRERLGSRRQLPGSSSPGESKHGEGCDGPSKRYGEKIDRHSPQKKKEGCKVRR